MRLVRLRVLLSPYFNEPSLRDVLGPRALERSPRFLSAFVYAFLLQEETFLKSAVVPGASEKKHHLHPGAIGALVPENNNTKALNAARSSNLRKRTSFVVFVHRESNWHIKLHATLLDELIRDAGYEGRIANENSDVDLAHETPIIVAPHEFWAFPNTSHLGKRRFRSQCIVYQTEQPQSQWFRGALPWVFEALAVLDVSSKSIPLYGTWIPASSLLLPFDHKSRKAVGLEPYGEAIPFDLRKYDICYFGAPNVYRDEVIRRLLDVLPNFNVALKTRDANSAERDISAYVEEYLAVTRNSKIHISISRHATGFFTWDRTVLGGMYSGALSIIAKASEEPAVDQGTHFFSVSAQQLPSVLDYLLTTDKGQALAAQVASQGQVLAESDHIRTQAIGSFTGLIRGLGLG